VIWAPAVEVHRPRVFVDRRIEPAESGRHLNHVALLQIDTVIFDVSSDHARIGDDRETTD